MSLEHVREFLDKELMKLAQKSSTSMSDQELMSKILCNYTCIDGMCSGHSSRMYHGEDEKKSHHSMRDREIAKLEERIDNASSDYERDFYRQLIRAAQDYKE